VELFVAVLGASNYTYAEATRTQQVPDWLASHQRAFHYFGGVTGAVVPDQLKSGVVVPCRYEPGLQRTYEHFAQHFGTVILPARPADPRDKAKIEVGVEIVERWILARLRPRQPHLADAMGRALYPRGLRVQVRHELATVEVTPHALLRMVIQRQLGAALRTLPAGLIGVTGPHVHSLPLDVQLHGPDGPRRFE